MSKRLICTTFFVIATIVHLWFGFRNTATVPAWTMFYQIPRFEYELLNKHGEPIDIREHVPSRAYVIVSHRIVSFIADWLQATYPEDGPYTGHISLLDDPSQLLIPPGRP